MVGIIGRKEVKMVQTIGEYIEQDAAFWTMINCTYYYCFVDTENDNEEVLIATYYPRYGILEWEKDKFPRCIAMNEPCEYVDRKSYTYNGDSVNVDILMYNLPEEEIEGKLGSLPKRDIRFLWEWFAPYYRFTKKKEDCIYDKDGNIDLAASRVMQRLNQGPHNKSGEIE